VSDEKLWDESATSRHFQQTLAKKTISRRGVTHWANVDKQFKDKSHNSFSNQYRSFLFLQYG